MGLGPRGSGAGVIGGAELQPRLPPKSPKIIIAAPKLAAPPEIMPTVRIISTGSFDFGAIVVMPTKNAPARTIKTAPTLMSLRFTLPSPVFQGLTRGRAITRIAKPVIGFGGRPPERLLGIVPARFEDKGVHVFRMFLAERRQQPRPAFGGGRRFRMAGNLGFNTYLVEDAGFTFARRDYSGVPGTAEELLSAKRAIASGGQGRFGRVSPTMFEIGRLVAGDQLDDARP